MRKNMAAGVILRSGDEFIITSKAELALAGIKVRKSGREAILDGKVKPVWEKKDWNQCPAIDAMFRSRRVRGEVYNLDAFLVKCVETFSVFDGLKVEYPQFCELW